MASLSPTRKSLRGPNNRDIEDTTLERLVTLRKSGIPVSGAILRNYALNVAEELNISNFKASTRWLGRFQERNGVSLKSLSGEKRSVDMSLVAVRCWLPMHIYELPCLFST